MCGSLEKSVQVAEAELWKTAKKMEGKKLGFMPIVYFDISSLRKCESIFTKMMQKCLFFIIIIFCVI